MIAFNAGRPIGPTFGLELAVAGLSGLAFSWGSDGTFQFDEIRMTPVQIAAVKVVVAAHDPMELLPQSSIVLALDAALSRDAPTLTQVQAVFVEWRKLATNTRG